MLHQEKRASKRFRETILILKSYNHFTDKKKKKKKKMAATKKKCSFFFFFFFFFCVFCIELSLHLPSFKVRGLQMTINFALV